MRRLLDAGSDKALFGRIAEKYARKDLARSSALVRKRQLDVAVRPVLVSGAVLGTIVEIGCGVGAPARHLAGAYRSYLGVDQAEEMAAAAQRFNAGNTAARFVVGDAATIDLASVRADLVLAVGALHHMADVGAVLRNVRRFVAPGAWFVAVEPQSANPVIQALRWTRCRVDPSYSHEQHFFARGELEELLRCHDLSGIETVCEGYFSTPFAQVVLPVQGVAAPLASAAVHLDELLAHWLPGMLRRLSWNVIIRARWPR